MRVLPIGALATEPSASNLKKGNQYIKYPSKKINNVLLNIFRKKAASLTIRYLSSEKLIALPTANKKEGNTRSVGVKPCHVACSKGANAAAPLPGVFTIIIKQMVIPLKTSSAKNLSCCGNFILKKFIEYCHCLLYTSPSPRD